MFRRTRSNAVYHKIASLSPEHCLFYFLSIFKLIINANQELN
ncbi:hypothetical protein BACCELL_03581 [Bacteroides cellulosilyticus DSM 14838]|uniref:Uncharacterized protein n=1 Tax=Bacteroides cellulosilyticus DSM 14838 TaxID=537012 RepID=E2NH06_9BACE|nr:hypothetical protein BACCELL_03581 [Bacteroides cellulosilyticus DSM 14838]